MGSPEITRRIVLRPRARAEIAEAIEWYRESGVAAEFLREVESALAKIAENPFLYQIVKSGIRRAPVRRFRYGLLYVVDDNEILILTCFHDRRNPQRWGNLI